MDKSDDALLMNKKNVLALRTCQGAGCTIIERIKSDMVTVTPL